MLDPGAREALTEQLRPPAGYKLSHAVGTTFTLDMISALAVPLSFVRGSGEDPSNAVALLNAVRKVSDRVDIFCQAGLIRMPRQANDLLAVLEPIIHQVRVPASGALFHPKIWLLEYESEADYLYRVLCSSRNLTPDASWDLLVRLDGRIPETDNAEAAADTYEFAVDNAPLSRFVQALPELSTIPLTAAREKAIRGLAHRVAAVRWELPQDIRTLAFRALGTGEAHSPNSLVGLLQNPNSAVGLNGLAGDRRNFGGNRLLVAPFVDDETLDILAGSGARTLQVYGRGQELDRLSPDTLGNPKAVFNAIDETGLALDEEPDTGNVQELGDLRGLHAKALFTDYDHTTHALIGSANATRAAFGQNVEFSVELTGPKNRIGTEKIVESLKDLPFVEFTGAGGTETAATEEAEWRLQNALIAAATKTYTLDAVPAREGDKYTVAMVHDYSPPSNMTARIGLLTLPGQLTDVPQSIGTHRHTFEGLPLAMVTPYVLVELRDTATGMVRSTVAQGMLRTDVDGRIEHIIASQLDTVEKLREFLLLFLTPEDQTPVGGGLFTGWFGTAGASGSFAGLFEAIAAAATSADAPQLFAGLKPVMDRLYQISDDSEIEEVRLLWDAAVAAVGEGK
ncbi:phospholipase D family protein [Arthrobacter wenxiniae]|uniref:PLD phosphodiesterase domain-containing protein n=1 Tax=Arthrobacter wenxiniae TaxID=2713570 RepID=A0A7Y7LZ50_9MICC|nr:phospholipase D family protein [Arthrobacter wenxiniae]NVM96175.1 hypothetical protein [Arthrobacter wenxiniae]